MLTIVLHLAYRYATARKGVAYKVLPNDASDDENVSTAETESDPMLLQAVQSEQLELEVDRPRGEIAVVALEIAALVGQIALYAVVLTTHGWGRHGALPRQPV